MDSFGWHCIARIRWISPSDSPPQSSLSAFRLVLSVLFFSGAQFFLVFESGNAFAGMFGQPIFFADILGFKVGFKGSFKEALEGHFMRAFKEGL